MPLKPKQKLAKSSKGPGEDSLPARVKYKANAKLRNASSKQDSSNTESTMISVPKANAKTDSKSQLKSNTKKRKRGDTSDVNDAENADAPIGNVEDGMVDVEKPKRPRKMACPPQPRSPLPDRQSRGTDVAAPDKTRPRRTSKQVQAKKDCKAAAAAELQQLEERQLLLLTQMEVNEEHQREVASSKMVRSVPAIDLSLADTGESLEQVKDDGSKSEGNGKKMKVILNRVSQDPLYRYRF